MMIRSKLAFATLAFVALLTACGPGDVAVVVEVELLNADTGQMEPRPISNLPIQLLPYDRDAIFDSLQRAASTPEPQLPEVLVIARDSINAARTEWQAAESRWLAVRERMVEIREEMDEYLPAEPQYRVLFAEFTSLEGEVAAAERTKDAAFARFERLQQATFAEMEAFNAQVLAWEDETFADFGAVVQARLREMSLVEMADTTDATGRATFAPKPAQYWVHARFPVATEELYWNEPVTVERGVPAEVRLTRENAEVRPLLF